MSAIRTSPYGITYALILIHSHGIAGHNTE
jgi:hypothetical protein